jgi:hypothetical protein
MFSHFNDPLEQQMSPDQFVITLSQMKLTDQNMISACEERLVYKEKNNEAVAKKYGVAASNLSTNCGNIVRKWDEICEKEGLICKTVALKPKYMALVELIEEDGLSPLKDTVKKKHST